LTIRVLLADDHRIVREGLKAILDRAPDIEVVAEAANGSDAVAKVLECRPDVAVMDLTMPEMGGVEATGRIAESAPGTKVLVLSMLMDRSCVVESLKSGAKGYLMKDCAAEELVGAIRAVAAGRPYLCDVITDLIIQDYSKSHPDEPRAGSTVLTTRESEVLKLISDGKRTKEIAFILGVSIKTVDAHRLNIMNKLELHSIAELTKYALREGFSST
jgi:DNA-binding NarL/FixJ family response regulator